MVPSSLLVVVATAASTVEVGDSPSTTPLEVASIKLAEISIVEVVAKSIPDTGSATEAISPVAAGFNDKQEHADANRCLLLFMRPKLSHCPAQEGAGAMENLSG